MTMTMTIDEIERKRAILKTELNELDAKLRQIAELSPPQRVADCLHASFCSTNHADGCGYLYSDWNKENSTQNKNSDRTYWFNKAVNLLKYFNENQINIFIAKFLEA